jgi:hypothetical protein
MAGKLMKPMLDYLPFNINQELVDFISSLWSNINTYTTDWREVCKKYDMVYDQQNASRFMKILYIIIFEHKGDKRDVERIRHTLKQYHYCGDITIIKGL